MERFNLIVSIVFMFFYSYQFFYIPVSLLFAKKRKTQVDAENRYAVLICARNEELVIGDLLQSIEAQTYPKDRISVFVMADNCTDDTAETARSYGASAYIRRDPVNIGKGYALERLMQLISADHPEGFDGYFVFDADNVLEPAYIEEMDKTFREGHDIVTSYRNSKNFGDNWISAGYALWFMRESRFLNGARSILGTSCAVSGTGFLFSRKIAEEMGTWKYHLLTEDIEFSIDQIIKGRKVAYCPYAMLYDEQPVDLGQSVRQRLRWAKGYVQVFSRYGAEMIKSCFTGSFSSYDMCASIMPAFVLSVITMAVNIASGICAAAAERSMITLAADLGSMMSGAYLTMFIIGAVTTVSEWKMIHTAWYKKVFYTFTFPLFMMTYIPISVAALFMKVKWKPVRHTVSLKVIKSRNREECPDIIGIAGN